MEKQQLNVLSVIDGKMLQAEEINYFGLTDFYSLASFQTGLNCVLQHFVMQSMEDGTVWNETIQGGVYQMFEVLDDVSKFKEKYLTRRIKSLEAALDLKHNGDIDVYDLDDTGEQ